mmetsp:Transcript_24490/g.63219  ORF Transcript_24490/g.63219 Transcript_24490/m.63219 type:complete len:230 (-) Transcript_24490:1317-2006(-)
MLRVPPAKPELSSSGGGGGGRTASSGSADHRLLGGGSPLWIAASSSGSTGMLSRATTSSSADAGRSARASMRPATCPRGSPTSSRLRFGSESLEPPAAPFLPSTHIVLRALVSSAADGRHSARSSRHLSISPHRLALAPAALCCNRWSAGGRVSGSSCARRLRSTKPKLYTSAFAVPRPVFSTSGAAYSFVHPRAASTVRSLRALTLKSASAARDMSVSASSTLAGLRS